MKADHLAENQRRRNRAGFIAELASRMLAGSRSLEVALESSDEKLASGMVRQAVKLAALLLEESERAAKREP
ncbi:MAG TPA: hypothetical protein VGJ84_16080 [Polyangiaceae bacterium]